MIFMLFPILVIAIVDWYTVYKGWKKLEIILKPTTMLLLFIWFFINSIL